MEFPNPPKVLYKYRPVNDHTKRIFTHNELWFSSVLALNDPFDCCFTAQPHPPTRENLDWNRNQNRVCAFTEKNDNLIMWAHYAAFHRGICLGFSFPQGLQDSILWKVQYTRDLPCHTGDPSKQQEFARSMITTKSEEWQYEQEWRLVAHPRWPGVMALSTEGMSLPIQPAWLTEVYLGARISQEHMNQVIRWVVDRKGPQVQLFLAKMHREQFALRFQPVR